jgi:hypothetical protein
VIVPPSADTVLKASDLGTLTNPSAAEVPLAEEATSGSKVPAIIATQSGKFTVTGEWTAGVTSDTFDATGSASYKFTLTAATGFTFTGTDIVDTSFAAANRGTPTVTIEGTPGATLVVVFTYELD